MDVKKLAAEAKAKALADLKSAEAMELAAEQIELMARQFGWKVTIDADAAEQKAIVTDAQKTTAAEAPSSSKKIDHVAAPVKRGGRALDPNSTTSRSKAESVKIVRELLRPVPLGEMAKRLEQRGVKLGGKNPNQALSANLGKVPELRPTPRGWWLKGMPVPRESASKVIGGGEEQLPGLN